MNFSKDIMQSKNILLLFFLVLFLASCSQQKTIEESLTWETLADILIPRSGGAGGAAIDGKIYVVGGTGSNAGQSLEMYNPTTNSWTEKAKMPTRRESPIVVAFENKLYVIGGTNPSAANGDYYGAQTAVVEIYDPATDTWSDSPSLNQKRDVAAGVVVSDKIYVLGGMVGLEEGMTAGSDSKGKPVVNTDTVEVYSPQTNNWTMLDAPMPVATRAMAYATVGKNIYLFGGCAGIVESPCTQTPVQIFDTETEPWRPAAEEMPTGRPFSGQGAGPVGTDI